LMAVSGYVCRILGIAPSLLRGAFHLVGYALIGQFLVSYGLANPLLDLARYLFHFAGYSILVHGLLSP
jgi:hypothetical protein